MMNGLESNKIVFDDCDITNLKDPDYDRIKRAVETRGILIIPKQDTNPIHFSKIISKIWGIDNYRFMAWNPDGSSAKTGLESLMNKQMPNPNPGDYWGDDNFRENPDYPDPFNWPAHKQYPLQRVTGEKRNDKWTGIFQLRFRTLAKPKSNNNERLVHSIDTEDRNSNFSGSVRA